jgi:hypothetical protein
MREVDENYGPLEWRLPEAHAVYWSTVGFRKSRRVDLITLRRTLYQPLQLAFQRGRLLRLGTPEQPTVLFGPNLAMIPRANDTYLAMARDDAEYRENILRAHRNFLKDAVYFLYTHNRRTEAERWFQYLLAQYPDAMSLDARREDAATVRLADLTLDEYAAAKVTEDIGEMSNVRVRSSILGFLLTHYYMLAIDEDDIAEGNRRIALAVHTRYQRETARAKQDQRIALPPFSDMEQDAFRTVEESYNPELVARLRTRLGLPASSTPPAASPTPQIPTNPGTNTNNAAG